MTSNSSDQLFESLSAMVDNEANELEVRRILKNLDSNPELMERWRRYHLIGSALRKERSVHVSSPGKLVESVALYIDSAPSQARPDSRSQQSGSWRDLLGKSAVAASFAATLVLGFNFMGGRDSDPVLTAAAPTPAPAPMNSPVVASALHTPVGFEVPVPEARTVSTLPGATLSPTIPVSVQAFSQMDDITDPATQQLLNKLLIEHAERASAHGSLGIMPFARVSRMNAEPVSAR